MMIRRTPQEIADFFGCYVAMDNDGNWYSYDREPIKGVRGAWSGPVRANFMNDSIEADYSINWETSLVAPQTKDAIEVFNSIQKRKHHAGEVYTHQEYQIVKRGQPSELEGIVNELIGIGWKPLGAPCITGDGCFQAMARGLER